MAINAICKHDQELWRAELLLICYYIVEWHEPEITQVSPTVLTYV
jgi:hypothetical protein